MDNFKEEEHPRDNDGKFTSKGGGLTHNESKRLKELGIDKEKTTKQGNLEDLREKERLAQQTNRKPVNTPYSKTELVKKIMAFEPIRLSIGNREIDARFDKTGAKEIIYGKSKSRNETINEYKTKLKNIDNLPEYISTSRYKNSAPELGKTTNAHKGVKEWHYFENNVVINSRQYNVFIDVRDMGDNQFVYSVKFKK